MIEKGIFSFEEIHCDNCGEKNEHANEIFTSKPGNGQIISYQCLECGNHDYNEVFWGIDSKISDEDKSKVIGFLEKNKVDIQNNHK